MRGRRWITTAVLVVTVGTTAAATLPGPGAPPARTFALLGLAMVGWGILLLAPARWGPQSRRVVLAAALLGGGLAVVAPPVGSSDVVSYAVYGRMVAAHHASPYTSVPADFPDDPWLPRMATFWHHTGSVYGPVFTGASAAIMAVAGASYLRGRLLFQLLELGAFALMLWLVDRKTRGDPRALVFAGLNPVLVASVLNGGHNDLLVGLGVLAGVCVCMPDDGRAPSRRALAGAGALIALAALVKLVALMALAALAVWAWRRHGRRAAATIAASGAGLTVVGYLAAGGPAALKPLLHASDQALLPAFWAYPRRWLTHHFASGGVADPAALAAHDVGRLALIIIGVLAVLLVLSQMDSPSPVAPVGAALLAYLVAGSYLMAWYPAWVLPVFALRPRSKLALVAALDSALLLLAHVELPSHLHGWFLVVERFLHDTLVPLLEVVLVVVLAAWAIQRLRAGRGEGEPTGSDPMPVLADSSAR